MTMLRRITAVCSVLGGGFWVAACVYRSTLPRGCVGDECLVGPMRGDTAVGTALFVVAGALLVAAAAGLVLHLHHHGRFGALGLVGVVCAAAGAVLLLAAVLVVSRLLGADTDLMPVVVVPGVVLVALGLVLVALVTLRSRLLPGWAAVGLLAGAALLVAANEQTAAVLFAVPFGVAWAMVGLALWPARAGASSPAPPTSTRHKDQPGSSIVPGLGSSSEGSAHQAQIRRSSSGRVRRARPDRQGEGR